MYAEFYRCFDTLIREFGQRDQFYIEIAQNLSRSLLMYLFRLINQTESTAGLLSGNRTMEQTLAYIEQHYREPITLEALAQACCANMYYLSHLFSRTQGVSVGRYILLRRLTEAQRLLADTALSVGAIAEAVGFADASYFCRVFKKECGITPRRFRAGKTEAADESVGTRQIG